MLLVEVSQSGKEDSPPEMLMKLKENYGGFIKLRKRVQPHWKHSWEWFVASHKAESFLRKIIPYSVGKKEQIEAALMFREEKLRGEDGFEQGLEFKQLLKDLKK